MSQVLDVLVVGGGLSGLLVARGANEQCLDWKLLEASPILGGRLRNDQRFDQIDLGGAWIWPKYQARILKLIQRDLHQPLKTFAQPDDPSSTRIVGGAVQIVHSIVKELDEEKNRITCNSPVVRCRLEKQNGETVVQVISLAASTESSGPSQNSVANANNQCFLARTVVFAIPPRLLSVHVKFDPEMSPSKQATLATSQTWMAGVTKVSLIYKERFWDSYLSSMGLPPGSGPGFQMYDASNVDGSVVAITVFSLVPADGDADKDDDLLAKRIAEQISTVWKHLGAGGLSEMVGEYSSYAVQRWSKEPYISHDQRPTRIDPHPCPLPELAKPEWDGRLLFAGTETDQEAPGVMEGAVGAAKRVLNELKTRKR